MIPVTPSSILAALALGASVATAQELPTIPDVAHASKLFEFADIPYKVDTDTHLARGPQAGYNICNSTTEGPTSMCQTMHFNGIDDFCLWGPPEMGQTVGDVEGSMVAWCTKPGHGTRLIPAGALHGVQWIRTPDYIQVVGFIDQTKINVLADDDGGEMDPHGADLRGNPMGGLVYTNAWSGSPQQVIEWHNFLGAQKFCFKACDPRGEFDDRYCEHILDRIGCDYNVPNNARNGTFESCDGDNQDFPGVYTDENGQVQTYSQPESDIWPVPYTPRTPASSNCVAYTSASLYSALPSATTSAAGSTETSEGASTRIVTRSSGTVSTPSRTGTETGSGNPRETADNAEASEEAGAARRVAIPGALVLSLLISPLLFA
ncbi:hypothetical protein CC2G_004252 [Coprinopsis cinerea AmutBmut pab1-1]|nr:hypothetical protein CC2G_004252 [Coprinopsis cinerea AmutBmut pab1-1]